VHCKQRKVRVTEVFEADRYSANNTGNSGQVRLTLTGEDGTTITINTKQKNIGKFPNVGETVTADIYLRPIQAG
jgi:hypothetical protein